MRRVRDLIQPVSSVAVALSSIEERDMAYAVIALTKYLQEIGKAVGVIISNPLSPEMDSLFKEHGVVYTNEAAPLRYVVSVDYGESGIDKVLHDIDKDSQKVKFYIVPSSGEFDFDDVKFDKEGSNYDLTMTLGVKSFSEMGDIYEKADHLFKENDVISFVDQDVESLGDETVQLRPGQSYSGLIRALVGHEMTDEIRELLIVGLVDDIKLLEGGADTEALGDLHEASKSGVDINDLIKRRYFSKTYKNVDLQIKLMHNLRLDRVAKVIWSIVSREDMDFAGVDKSTLDTKGRIIFNLSSEFDIAFAAYELERGLIKVVVESNNSKYSASKIAGVYKGRGNDQHAAFILRDINRSEFEKTISTLLKDLYDVTLRSEAGDLIPESSPIPAEVSEMSGTEIEYYDGMTTEEPIEPLTNPLHNDKNMSDVADGPIGLETGNDEDDLLDY